MSYDKKEYYIRLPVLLNLLNSLLKAIKCSTSHAFYRFTSTLTINSIKHEHSCKIGSKEIVHLRTKTFENDLLVA